MTDQEDPGTETDATAEDERDAEKQRDEAEREGIAEDNRLERALGHDDEG